MLFKEFIEKKYVQWQSEQGKRKTVSDFAAYLGVSQPLLSMWMSGSKKPGIENIRLLSQIYGFEVYDVLGLPRPDEDLAYITQHWEKISPEFRQKFRQEVEEYLDYEFGRVQKNRRPRSRS